jgi:hypothetical protein
MRQHNHCTAHKMTQAHIDCVTLPDYSMMQAAILGTTDTLGIPLCSKEAIIPTLVVVHTTFLST